MNFVGKFDAKLPVDGSGAAYVAHTHVDAASGHAPADAIVIPDAKLLFEGDFKRSGVDLVLSKDDHEMVVHDYFKGEKRAALSSPDGAHLTGDIVNALTGHVEYAQASGAVAAAVVVGHVTKMIGSATAIRNGVSIILNQGDNIDKGDVLQSGADSTLGVTFIDGTVFGLSSNARMVVNEMVYDPNGSNNSSLLSLVAGTISFVAGETAKHGDMKVDTPVATMGIRGTAVLVEIDFGIPGTNGTPSANFQVLVEPDGTTGSYILFDKTTLTPLATVNAAGTLTKISQGVVSFQAGTPLTADEQKLITDVFQQKFTDNTNPKSIDHQFTDSIVPQPFGPIRLADGTTATPIVLIVPSSNSAPAASDGTAPSTLHIPGGPTVVTFDSAFTERAGVTGSSALDTVSGQVRFVDVNAGDLPTVKVAFSSFTYQDAHHSDITNTLTAPELAAVKAVEAINLQTDPDNNNNGSATWTYSFADGAFDFLGAGETLTLTYIAAVNNNYTQNPETTFQSFTVTIVGTNDVPVITSGVPQTIAFVGGTSVPGGDLTAHVPTSGTISFDDPDLTDTHTVSVTLLLNGLDLPPTPLKIFESALTASIGTDSTGTGFGTVNWKLADLPVYLADFIPKGETISLVYAVTVTDSQGATSTQDITVTITGTDTPAVVWIATTETGSAPGGLWSDASNWETGTVPTATDDAIIITDQLIGLTPSYPVTIDAATSAAAKSVTMNDFGTSPPELINLGQLTVGGAFDMSADSIVHNSGTISVGGLMEVLDTSVVLNSGGIALRGGGDFSGQSTITNTATGLIEVTGGTLNVGVDIANSGQVAVDYGATLKLNGAAIDGTVINEGTLDLTGNAVLNNGTTYNAGQINVSGTGNSFVNETINNGASMFPALFYDLKPVVNNPVFDDPGAGGVTIVVGSVPVLPHAIDVTGTLTLNGATISGGAVSNTGTIDITGDSTITGAWVTGGQITIEADQTLTLGGTSFGGGGVIEIAGDPVTVIVAPSNDDVPLTSAGVYVSGSTITNDGTIKVDADSAIWLGDVAIGGGAIADSGSIEIVGSSSINNDLFGNSQLIVDVAQTLTLDGTTVTGGTVTNDGTLAVDAEQTLTLQGGIKVTGGTLSNSGTVDIETSTGATLDGVTVTGSGTILVDAPVPAPAPATLVLDDGTSFTGGTLTVGPVGTLAIKTAGGATLDHEAVTNNNSIEVFAGSALTLDGGTAVTNNSIITIDGTGTLTLNDASIDGGIINNYSPPVEEGGVIPGTIDVTGSSTISNAHLNSGNVTLGSDVTLTLGGDTVAGTSFTATGATILIDGADTLDDVTITGGALTNTDATLTVDAGQTLTLQDGTTITGGTLANSGVVEIEGSEGLTLSQVTVTGPGTIQIDDDNSSSSLILEGGSTFTGGKLTVGLVGLLEIQSALGATLNDEIVTNKNSIEVFAGSVLTLDSGTAVTNNSGATFTVDGTGTLKLNGASIAGGTIVDNGLIDVTGDSIINGHAALSGGQVKVESAKLTLDNVTVTGTSFNETTSASIISVDQNNTLTLAGTDSITGVTGSSIGNAGLIDITGTTTLTTDTLTNTGTLQVDGTLKLNGTTLSGGIIADNNLIDVTGDSIIDGNAALNGGQVKVESAKLTLDNVTVTGTSFNETTSASTISVDQNNTLTLAGTDSITGVTGSSIANAGLIDVTGTTTLTTDTLTNTGTLQVDGTLKLNGTTLSGGIINDNNLIDVTGDSTINGHAALNGGQVKVESAKLTLDNVTVTGTSFSEMASGSTISVDQNNTLTLAGTDSITGVTGSSVANAGLIDITDTTTLTTDTLTNTGTLQVDGTLKLNGTTLSGGIITDNNLIDVTGDSIINGHAALNGSQVEVDSATLTLDNVTVTGTSFSETTSGSIISVDANETLTLAGTDSIAGVTGSSIANAGLIDVTGTTTLTTDTLTNTGTLQVDGTLKLNGTTLSGGIINDNNLIDVTGDSTIDGHAALNGGQVKVESAKLTLDNVTVTGTSFSETTSGSIISVDANDTLILAGISSITGVTGSSIANAGLIDITGTTTLTTDTLTDTGTLQVDGTLKLNGTTLSGGTITDDNLIDVTGDSTIDGNAALNGGQVKIESAKLTLDNVTVTGTSFSEMASGSTISVDQNNTLTLAGTDFITGATGSSIANAGLIDITGTTTLTTDTLTDTGTLQVDGTLKLNGTTLSGGTITDDNLIDVTGDSTINGNAVLNGGQVKVESAKLTLDNVTVTGTSFSETASGSTISVDQNNTLTFAGTDSITGVTGSSIANAGLIDITGTTTLTADTLTDTGTLQVDGTLKLNGTTLSGGTITDNNLIDVTGDSTINGNATLNGSQVEVDSATLTLDNVTVTGTSFSEMASGSTISVDQNNTLTLAGTDSIIGVTGSSIANAGLIDITGTTTLTTGTLTNTGTLQVDADAQLNLSGASIVGGTVTDNGLIDVTGDSTINGNAALNGGQVKVESAKLTLDNVTVTGTSFSETTSASIISVDQNNTLTLAGTDSITGATGSSVANAGLIDITGTTTLTTDTLTNTGTLQVDADAQLNLSGVSISGGIITDNNLIDVTGDSTINGHAALNGSQVKVDSAKLTLNNVTVTGTSFSETASGSTISVDQNNTLTLAGTDSITGATGSSIANAGLVDITGTTTLTTDTLTNTGTLQVDGTLKLNGTTLGGGTIADNNLIDVTGDSTINGHAALNGGQVKVESAKLTLDNVTVTGTSFSETASGSVISVDAATTLILAGISSITGVTGSSIINAGLIEVAGTTTLTTDTLTDTSILQVDSAAQLNLSGASIAGGTITDNGLIDVTGDSTINGHAALNGGQVEVDSATLTLDNVTVTGTSFSETASGSIISVDQNNTLTLAGADFITGATGSSIANAGLIEITGTTTLTTDTLTNTNTLQVDADAQLNLSGASISGGTITDNGLIDVSGDSTIDGNAALNGGQVKVESGQALTLDGDTVTGTTFTNVATGSIHVDGGDTLALNGATVTGGGFTIGAAAQVTTSGDVTLTTAITNDGTIEVTGGTLTVTGSVASSAGHSGSIQIDAGAVLDLDASDTQNVVFNGANAELHIETSSFGGTISGLAPTDEIDLSGIDYALNPTGSFSGDVLTITDGSNPPISMTLDSQYSSLHFVGSSDGHGGTLITLSATDDAPVFAAADKAETATVSELAGVTGSLALDVSTPTSGTLHFTDIDLTDRPTAAITQTVSWTDGTNDLSSSLTSDEINALESAFAISQSGNTNNGTVGWTYQITDSALDFLSVGETATVTTTVTLSDHQGDTDTATVTVTIAGANDAPTITATGGDLAETAGITGSPATDTVAGTISFADVDLDDRPSVTASLASSNPFVYMDAQGHDITATLTSAQLAAITALESGLVLTPDNANANNGTVGWSYSVTDSALDFLGSGDTLTLNYAATVIDQHGASATAPIAVTITGSDDAPTITATDGALAEAAGITGSPATDTATGTVTFTDVDLTDRPTVTASFTSYDYKDAAGDDITSVLTPAQQAAVAALEHGLVLSPNNANANNGTVGWSYSVTDSALDFLGSGDTLVLNYSATVNDGHGGTAIAPIRVAITGSDDAPTVSVGAVVSTDENHALTIDGITVNDVDAGTSQIEVTLAAHYGSLALANSTGLANVVSNAGSIELFGSQAAINTALALGVLYTPGTDLSGADTLTVTANDQVSAALGGPLTGTGQLTVNVEPGTPIFSGMTLTIAQGATDVLTDGNFSITDPDTLHFLYTVSDVTGGQFEVSNGATWTAATSFSTAQVEAGHVEFIQDGSSTAPNFSIFASDGANHSAAIAPTVDLTPDLQFIGGTTTDTIHEVGAVDLANPTAMTYAANGVLSFTDSDGASTHTVQYQLDSDDSSWTGGVLGVSELSYYGFDDSLNATLLRDTSAYSSGEVYWSFSLPVGASVFLSEGQTLTLNYLVSVTDQSGVTASQDVTITVDGAVRTYVYNTLDDIAFGNTPAVMDAYSPLTVNNDPNTSNLAIWTPQEYNASPAGELVSYGGTAPYLLVNPENGAVLVEIDQATQININLGYAYDTLDVSEQASSPLRTVPIVANGGILANDDTVILGSAYADLPRSDYEAIYSGNTIIGVAITHAVNGLLVTDDYTNIENFVGNFSAAFNDGPYASSTTLTLAQITSPVNVNVASTVNGSAGTDGPTVAVPGTNGSSASAVFGNESYGGTNQAESYAIAQTANGGSGGAGNWGSFYQGFNGDSDGNTVSWDPGVPGGNGASGGNGGGGSATISNISISSADGNDTINFAASANGGAGGAGGLGVSGEAAGYAGSAESNYFPGDDSVLHQFESFFTSGIGLTILDIAGGPLTLLGAGLFLPEISLLPNLYIDAEAANSGSFTSFFNQVSSQNGGASLDFLSLTDFDGSIGGNGGNGGSGGNGGNGTAQADANTIVTGRGQDTVNLEATSTGGTGGNGGGASQAGYGAIAGTSGSGGVGGNGGAASSEVADNTVTMGANTTVLIQAEATGGAGGSGGNGGDSGLGLVRFYAEVYQQEFLTSSNGSSIPYYEKAGSAESDLVVYGPAGDGGNGGSGGAATATVHDNNIQAGSGNETITVVVDAQAGQGGAGGLAGNDSPYNTDQLYAVTTDAYDGDNASQDNTTFNVVAGTAGVAGATGATGVASAVLQNNTFGGGSGSDAITVELELSAGGAASVIGNHITGGSAGNNTIALQLTQHDVALTSSGNVLDGDGGGNTLNMAGWDLGIELNFNAGTFRLDAASSAVSGTFADIQTVIGTTYGDTFDNVGGGATIVAHAHDTYTFNSGFGSATIENFATYGGMIELNSSLFSGETVAQLLANATTSGSNTIITDHSGETITFQGMTPTQLQADATDFQLTIANAGTFAIGTATNEALAFQGSTGSLTLDHPSSFSGTISGFTGDGTLSGSDQIDLKGIDYHSSSFSESFDASNDTLSVTDGANSALLHFNGTYQAANFNFTSDSNGGTIVYDPPVTDNAAAKPPAPAPAVTANSHGFVFNFPDNGHAAGGVHPSGDTHLFDGQTFVNAEADLNKPHDDGHGHVAALPDSMDAATIAAVKAQLHAHDFHFV